MSFENIHRACMNKAAALSKKAEAKKDTKTASAHHLTAYDILADVAARGLHKKAGWWDDYRKETAKAIARPAAQIADEAFRQGQDDAMRYQPKDHADVYASGGVGAFAGGTIAGLLADSKSSPARKLAQILAGAGLGGAAGLGFGAVRGFMDRSRLSAAPYEKALDEQVK